VDTSVLVKVFVCRTGDATGPDSRATLGWVNGTIDSTILLTGEGKTGLCRKKKKIRSAAKSSP